MTVKNKFYKGKSWMLPFSLILLLLAIVIIEQIFTSPDAAASKQAAGSVSYSPPPHMAEIEKEVKELNDLIYHDSDNSVLDIYYPEKANEPLPVIVWIHGGGYIGGSKDSRRDYGMTLAHSGYVVANIDYSLAPAQKYPGPILQANAALEYLQLHAAKFGGDMSRIFIGGDSAGAQIASQVSAVISNKELAGAMGIEPVVQADQLRGAILFCGLFNMETVRATEFPNIELFLNAYTGVEPFESFKNIGELSTVDHITADYPAVFITVGDGDPFSTQSQELVNTLQSNNISVSSVFFEGTQKNLQHEYQYALDTIDAQETLEKTVDFLYLNSQ